MASIAVFANISSPPRHAKGHLVLVRAIRFVVK
jgi:hypothetical protein